MPVIFQPYPKQQEFINAATSGKYKYIFYGGAAGGGKTWGTLGLLVLLCKIYKGSKWTVVRKDATKLEENTIPSFNKICPKHFISRGRVVSGKALMTNSSEINFIAENYAQDKDANWMDGHETNGFLFEECQELQKKTFEKSKLRAGRNILPIMPPIINIITGNPSQNWSKDMFHTPFKEGNLQPPYLYIPANMNDNPGLPQEYLDNMGTLDSITYRRYVLGDWDAIDVEMPFAYSFNVQRHVKKLQRPTKSQPVYLSFDFNVDPITCIVSQHAGGYIRIHAEYRLRDSNIFRMCERIREEWKDYYFYVTGDASGQARSALVAENMTYYTIIMNELGLKGSQMRVPDSNPLISNNRTLVNSILEKHPDILIDPGCKFLIDDLLYCEVNKNGDIDKKKDKYQTHLLDCFRYYIDTFHSDFVKYKP